MSKYLQSNLKSAQAALKETQDSSDSEGYSDDRWKPDLEKGKDRTEYIIRFLPNPDSITGSNYVQRNAHMFNFPSSGDFVYEPCSLKPKKTNNKGPCFFCEQIDPWFADDADQNKKNKARNMYAKPRYFSNIYIVSDSRDSGVNEGKVKIFEYGKKIFQMCYKSLLGDEQLGKEGIEYYHLMEGVNFKLVVTEVQNERGKTFPTYDESAFFAKPGPVEFSNGDVLEVEGVDEFMDKAFSLNEKLLSDGNFKSYEDLTEIWDNEGYPKKKPFSSKSEDTGDSDKGITSRNPSPSKKVEAEKEIEEETKIPVTSSSNDDDDDDDLDSLLNDDD